MRQTDPPPITEYTAITTLRISHSWCFVALSTFHSIRANIDAHWVKIVPGSTLSQIVADYYDTALVQGSFYALAFFVAWTFLIILTMAIILAVDSLLASN